MAIRKSDYNREPNTSTESEIYNVFSSEAINGLKNEFGLDDQGEGAVELENAVSFIGNMYVLPKVRDLCLFNPVLERDDEVTTHKSYVAMARSKGYNLVRYIVLNSGMFESQEFSFNDSIKGDLHEIIVNSLLNYYFQIRNRGVISLLSPMSLDMGDNPTTSGGNETGDIIIGQPYGNKEGLLVIDPLLLVDVKCSKRQTYYKAFMQKAQVNSFFQTPITVIKGDNLDARYSLDMLQRDNWTSELENLIYSDREFIQSICNYIVRGGFKYNSDWIVKAIHPEVLNFMLIELEKRLIDGIARTRVNLSNSPRFLTAEESRNLSRPVYNRTGELYEIMNYRFRKLIDLLDFPLGTILEKAEFIAKLKSPSCRLISLPSV